MISLLQHANCGLLKNRGDYPFDCRFGRIRRFSRNPPKFFTGRVRPFSPTLGHPNSARDLQINLPRAAIDSDHLPAAYTPGGPTGTQLVIEEGVCLAVLFRTEGASQCAYDGAGSRIMPI